MDISANASQAPSRAWLRASIRAVAVMGALTSFALYECLRLSAITNNDIWWHLRTGLWILENHAVPRNGLFSQSASLPWTDANWGFEVLTAFFYRLGGLAGLPGLLMCLQIGVAVALFALALSAGKKLWLAVGLCIAAQFCLMPLQPNPAVCSIGFLAVELALIAWARSTEDARALYWLPLVFAVWVNFDRQFTFGLLTLVIFCGALILERLRPQWGAGRSGTAHLEIRLSSVAAITGASILATLVSPYGWHLYCLAWQNATHSAADRFFRDLHSLRFRQPQDYVLMLLTMTAYFALGRRRSRDLFLIMLLIVSTAISFRSMRDNWIVVVCSVAIIGSALRDADQAVSSVDKPVLRRNENLATAVSVLLLLLAMLAWLPIRNDLHGGEFLLAKMEERFPLGATDYISGNHLPQPIFNTYDWGGFLTFALPEYQVSIDGRSDLYGDDLDAAYFRLMQAEVPLRSDPTFARAQTIILEADSPIAQALDTLPDFHEVYRDKLAIVFVRGK
jgi:hypothetical protein